MSIFINIFNEEPMDKLTLESLKGGDTCTCNGSAKFICTCYGGTEFIPSCTCDGATVTFECSTFSVLPNPNPKDDKA